MARTNEEYTNEVAGYPSEDRTIAASSAIVTQGTSPWLVSGTVDANVTVGLFDIILASGSNVAGTMDSRILAVNSSILQSVTSVASSVTPIPSSNLLNRECISIANDDSSTTCYVGNNTVTTANGFPLYAKSSIDLDLGDSVTVYGITSGGTVSIRTLEVS
jgi:hypothetical protein